MSSPIEQFEQLQSDSKFIFLICYRGHWCPFCLNWIKSFATIAPSIKAAGGAPIIVTAEENPEFLAAVRDKTGYKDAAILDPENTLAGELKNRGVLDVAITEKSGYPSGMAQPGVLVMREGRMLFGWAIKPNLMNIGGAKDRPSLVQVWEDVEAEMQGKESVHEGVYRKQTFFQGVGMKLFG